MPSYQALKEMMRGHGAYPSDGPHLTSSDHVQLRGLLFHTGKKMTDYVSDMYRSSRADTGEVAGELEMENEKVPAPAPGPTTQQVVTGAANPPGPVPAAGRDAVGDADEVNDTASADGADGTNDAGEVD